MALSGPRAGQTFRDSRRTNATRPLWRTWLVMAWLGVVAGMGCASGAPAPQIGRLPRITSGNAAAERDLSKARQALREDNPTLAEARYRAFIERYADDPLVPVAQLELGRLLLSHGEVAEAHGLFAAVSVHEDAAVAEQGRFYGAVTAFRQGRPREAATTLRPMVGRTIDPHDTTLLLQTLAEAELSLGNLPQAAVALDHLVGEAAAADEVRAAAEQRLIELIEHRAAAAEVEALLRALPEDGAGFGHALKRAVRDAQAAHDTERTRELLDIMRASGLSFDEEFEEIAVRASRPGDADPRAVGAILSLTGRARQVGELALRGLMLAAGLPPDGPTPANSPRLIFRDDGGDPDAAVRAVDELVSVHHVIAIVGPMNSDAARAAAQRAEEIGVPLIALTPTADLIEGDSAYVFQIFPTAQAEVGALVAQAVREGSRRFAIMRPEGAYGDAMQLALEQATSERGAELVAAQIYPPDATAFGHQVADLAARRPDALLIADAASRLALIAPALAAAGMWSAGPDTARPEGDRVVQLLAPSVAFDHAMAERSARYLQGALFAVAFDATTAEGHARGFVDSYVAQFGVEPSAFAALAHDAYVLIESITAAGATTREALRDGLQAVHGAPVAGPSTGFDAQGSAKTPTRLLRMTEDGFVPMPDQ